MRLEELKEFWEEAGKKFPRRGKITPTSRDPYLAELERERIGAHLGRNHATLEVGCGDAVHSLYYARIVRSLIGLDVAESLVERARRRARKARSKNVRFVTASVLEAGKTLAGERFNSIVSQRCLINLPTWTYQRSAIEQIHSLLKKGGLFLMSEGFDEELSELNSVRASLGLNRIKVVGYNRMFVRRDFERFVKSLFRIENVLHYGTYLLLSRAFYPAAVAPQSPRHDSRMNQVAMLLDRTLGPKALPQFSYNSLYVLSKA
jgi:SAM-dependent methyltransferase